MDGGSVPSANHSHTCLGSAPSAPEPTVTQSNMDSHAARRDQPPERARLINMPIESCAFVDFVTEAAAECSLLPQTESSEARRR